MVEAGRIYVETCGYSVTYYKFWKVLRVTDKSMIVQQYAKKHYSGNYMNQCVVADLNTPVGKPRRFKLNKYIGHVWDGTPQEEDHWD